jgi:drug/metabolite transporter (DMT)-like permease
MRTRDLADLVLLAALWGASFLFMRLAAPDFGPLPLAAVRVALAAVLLLALLTAKGLLPALRQHWRPIALVGVLNTAIPFVLFNIAALHITAGLSSVFNATAPLWGALVAWLWLHDKPAPSRAFGLALGFVGVLWLGWDKAGFKPGVDASGERIAVLACLTGTLCYGIAANFTKQRLAGVPSMAVAAGSQTAAAVALAAPAVWLWPTQWPAPMAWLWAGLLGVLCTALAYLLYFRLIANIGPARAISVTFIIPLFGVLWGGMFLGEAVTPVMLAAGAVIVLGTALATGVIVLPGGKKVDGR